MVLYFKNSKGREWVLGYPETIQDAHDEMNKFMDAHNYKNYYTQVWEENGRLKFDVGCYTEFFYLEGISLEDYIEGVSTNNVD